MADIIPFTDDEILTQAAERFTEFFECSQFWRNTELLDGYSVYEGKQWLAEDEERYKEDGLPIITINKTAPVVDSISGFEIQNRTEVSYTPRMVGNEDARFADVVENGVNYIESNAQSAFHNSMAFLDTLICGVGFTDTIIDYNKNDRGEVVEERFFPGFAMWDWSARDKNLKGANWIAKAKIVDRRSITEEDEEEYVDTGTFSFDDQMFLNFFNILNTRISLTVVYDYQWRKLTDVLRVKNPFMAHMDDDLIMNYAAEAQKIYKINIEDGSFTFEPKMFRQFKAACESLGMEVGKPLKQKRYKYYRSVIKGGRVTEKSENYSQQGFSIQAITGKYSETDQCHYGVMRAAKNPQRQYNMAMSDMQGFLNTVPKGGVIVEADATPDLKGFIRTWAKSKLVSVVAKGAISGNKIMPKPTPQLQAGLPEMLASSDSSIMQVAGVSPQFMGMLETKEMTGRLQGQLVRQTLSMLAQYFDAKKFFMIDKGRLYIDCLRVLAENDPGRPMKSMMGQGADKYMQLFLDDIAAEYDIEITDTPETPDEKQDKFEKLLELAAMLMQQGANIIPLVMQYAPLTQDEIEEVTKAMMPPPPPPPDPLQQEMLKSTVALQYANAEKTKADAVKINMEVLNKQQENTRQPEKEQADIRKTYSEIDLNRARAADLLTTKAKD